jgi:serine/threonine protein kinase
MALLAGTRLGPYEILAAIGAGGMGEVYRARDTKLNRDVAIKVLPELFAADPERLPRFKREAQVMASLNHPNIAHIHGLEESQGVQALVMELIEGEDLAERLSRGRIPLLEALPIARQIAEALEAAHEQGIIHRDLKPANIKARDDGTVKVLDFRAGESPRTVDGLERGQLPDTDSSSHAGRHHSGDRRLYGAGAGARESGGPARRRVFVRRSALRDPRGHAGVPRRVGERHARVDLEGRS